MAGKAEFDTTADKATETFKTAAAAPETTETEATVVDATEAFDLAEN